MTELPSSIEVINICKMAHRLNAFSKRGKLCQIEGPRGISPTAGQLGAFSLIELLVVIVILGMLAVFATSVIPTKNGGQISHARGIVGDLAMLARQNAISKNAVTTLIIAEVNSGGIVRSAASIWDAQTSSQLEKWNLLPESVRAFDSSGFAADPFAGARFRGQAVSNSVAYWFYPDGRMGNDPSLIPKLTVQARHGGGPDICELVFNPTVGTFKVKQP